MKWNGSTVAMVVAAVFSVGVGAQTGSTMAKDKMDTMDMKDTTYTGCIEAGGAAGMFTLTHVVEDHMGKEMMKDSKDTSAMAAGHMEHDAMAPAMLSLTGTAVDLRTHLGHKVAVTGSVAQGAMEKDSMNAATTSITVKRLKMIARSCS